MVERIEKLPATAFETSEMPATSMSDWLLRQDEQAVELIKKDPSQTNEVTKTFLMLYAANKYADPPREPDKVVPGMLWGTKTVRGDLIMSPTRMGIAAVDAQKSLQNSLENERPTYAGADTKAVERNYAKIESIKSDQTVESVDVDPRMLDYLRLIAVSSVGDRMKEAQFVNDYFKSLNLDPMEVLSMHTMLHRTIVAIDEGKLPMSDVRGRFVVLCKKLEDSVKKSDNVRFAHNYAR